MMEKSLVLWYHTFYGSGASTVYDLILVISPDVTYHLLMRYQWVPFLIPAPGIYGAASKRRLFHKNVCRKERLQFGG